MNKLWVVLLFFCIIGIVFAYYLDGNKESFRMLDAKDPTDPFKDAELQKTNEISDCERTSNNTAQYSGNLQNKKGKLCLSQKQIWLLKTRGGNASTGEAQIG
jgi:hypothetical protein